MTSAAMELSVTPPAGAQLMAGAPGALAGGTTSEAAASFASLIQLSLAATAAGRTVTARTEGTNGHGDTDPDPAVEADAAAGETAPPGIDAALAALVAALLPTMPQGAPSVHSGQPGAPDRAVAGGSAPVTASSADAQAALPTAVITAPDVVVPSGAPRTPETPATPAMSTTPATPGTPAVSTTPAPPARPVAAPVAGPVAGPGAAPATDPARDPLTERATERAADPGSTQVVTAGPVRVTGPIVPGTLPGTDGPGRAVATQVIPEITRLVSDGDGVHRVTLQLNPKALGEVRVVLTMRHGDVHVRLTAGEDARHALAASSGELSRALHSLGIDEHRITLIDLQRPETTTRTGHDPSDTRGENRQHANTTGGFDTERHEQNSQHSWMGDDHTARDGSANPSDRNRVSARIQPIERTRLPGELDLRM